jgi:hypothetical protein
LGEALSDWDVEGEMATKDGGAVVEVVVVAM